MPREMAEPSWPEQKQNRMEPSIILNNVLAGVREGKKVGAAGKNFKRSAFWAFYKE